MTSQNHGRDSLEVGQKCKVGKADFGDLLWTLGGIFGTTFARVLEHVKEYKYPS